MPDIDEIFEREAREIAALASGSARQRPFAAVERVGRLRHRRHQVALVGGSALAAVAVIVVAAAGAGTLSTEPASDPANPGPTAIPTPTPPLDGSTPKEIVTGDWSTLSSVAISSQDPDVRVSVWTGCGRRTCGDQRYALAVTGDAFSTTAYVTAQPDEYPLVTPVGGAFVVVQGTDHFLVRPDGTRASIPVDPLRRSLAPGEVLVGDFEDGDSYGYDSVTGTAHPLPASVDRYAYPVTQQPDGRLVRVGAGSSASSEGRAAVGWSDDGGGTWTEHEITTSPGALLEVLASGDPDTIAVVEGRDGATLFPFDRIHYSHDGGRTWRSAEPFSDLDDDADLGFAVVRLDGSLFAYMSSWSDQRRIGSRSDHPYGPYASTDGDLADLRPTTDDLPGKVDDQPLEVQLRSVVSEDGNQTVFLTGANGRMWSSSDGGETWTRTPDR